MKKRSHKKRCRSGCFGMEATTTSKDWGFIPVPGKGGRTTNGEGSDTIIYREKKDLSKN